MNEKEKVLTHLDIPYSYELAKRMEAYRCNPELGYRSAGSKAEFLTGEMLKKEMEEIGLSGVTKDEITVDGWEFRKAVLYVLPKMQRFRIDQNTIHIKNDPFFLSQSISYFRIRGNRHTIQFSHANHFVYQSVDF